MVQIKGGGGLLGQGTAGVRHEDQEGDRGLGSRDHGAERAQVPTHRRTTSFGFAFESDDNMGPEDLRELRKTSPMSVLAGRLEFGAIRMAHANRQSVCSANPARRAHSW